MKKAVVVGGSNGIGFAIANALIDRGYKVYIVDKRNPEDGILDDKMYTFMECDLLDFNEEIFTKLSEDEDIELLMITAGFGRVAHFEYLHTAEIDNLIKVNTIATIKIISIFYDKIKSNKSFYCGVMGSIAGLCSSPLFSVYAASKAAVCRFVESVNIELEAEKYSNRILNVSPGSIKGTKFNGGENDLSFTAELASVILVNLFEKKDIYIPEYDKIYKGVLERYSKDYHEYGMHSYEYKIKSGRVYDEKKIKIGYLSGTFDLFHVGHLKLLQRAKKQCDYLIVGVHPNATHKGKETFIPFDERMKIVGAIKYVDKVVESCPEDSDAWELWHYNKLFVGSDYKGSERFKRYEDFFEDKDVEIVYFPYTQGTSSTQIRNTVLMKTNSTENS